MLYHVFCCVTCCVVSRVVCVTCCVVSRVVLYHVLCCVTCCVVTRVVTQVTFNKRRYIHGFTRYKHNHLHSFTVLILR